MFQVKNNSERVLHVGNASILPGEVGDVEDAWRDSITNPDFEIVKGKKATVAKTEDKTEGKKVNPDTGKEINPLTGLDIDPVTGKDIPAK